MRKTLAVAALALVVATVARAGLGEGALQPVLLRLQGHVGAPRPGDRGVASLTLRRGDVTIDFQVDEVWVLSGGMLGNEVLAEVAPYTPNVSLAGPAPVLDRL